MVGLVVLGFCVLQGCGGSAKGLLDSNFQGSYVGSLALTNPALSTTGAIVISGTDITGTWNDAGVVRTVLGNSLGDSISLSLTTADPNAPQLFSGKGVRDGANHLVGTLAQPDTTRTLTLDLTQSP